MAFDIFVWVSALWMLFIVFTMSTSNLPSLFIFKITPFVLAIGLLVFWAHDAGFIINTGG